MYTVTNTHFRDIYGKFLWAAPLDEECRLYKVGEEFILDEVKYRIVRVALVEDTQHVNVEVVVEDLNVVMPFL